MNTNTNKRTKSALRGAENGLNNDSKDKKGLTEEDYKRLFKINRNQIIKREQEGEDYN